VQCDVEVLNGAGEEFFFCRHSFNRITTFWSGLARVFVNFAGRQWRGMLTSGMLTSV
jgi:hypothetical protein